MTEKVSKFSAYVGNKQASKKKKKERRQSRLKSRCGQGEACNSGAKTNYWGGEKRQLNCGWGHRDVSTAAEVHYSSYFRYRLDSVYLVLHKSKVSLATKQSYMYTYTHTYIQTALYIYKYIYQCTVSCKHLQFVKQFGVRQVMAKDPLAELAVKHRDNVALINKTNSCLLKSMVCYVWDLE